MSFPAKIWTEEQIIKLCGVSIRLPSARRELNENFIDDIRGSITSLSRSYFPWPKKTMLMYITSSSKPLERDLKAGDSMS